MRMRQIDSAGELLEILRSSGCDYYLFGNDSETQGNAYLFEFCIKKRILIGVINENNGLTPSYYTFNNIIVLGYNSQIAIINTNGEQKILYADSFFYEFLISKNTDRILAIFELEIIYFSLSGEIIWKHYCRDVIVDYHTVDNYLYIVTDSGTEVLCI